MRNGLIDQAIKILEPLEENPKGLRMSRSGANACIHNIAGWYMEEVKQNKQSFRPKAVRDELHKIAETANELKKYLLVSADTQTILSMFYASLENPQDMTLLDLFDDFDKPRFPGSAPSKKFKLKGCFEADAPARLLKRLPTINYSPALWIARLDCLESFTRTAAEDPRLHDSGGPLLRAIPKWIGTPNHQLIYRCRALLAACGRRHGGSKDGNLVKLLSAIAGKEESVITTFNNDIKEVLSDPYSANRHKLAVARLLLPDLIRRRPLDDPDIRELEERLSASWDRYDEGSTNPKTTSTPEK